MLRRRPPSSPPASTIPHGEALLDRLRTADWVLPRALGADRTPTGTLVGTFGSDTTTFVDSAGLIVGEGWSLDWWVGADDRWHLPARESAVRQRAVGDVPIVETRLRIPGGDAVARAYGLRSPRREGDEWVVAEIENATAIPFAVTLVVRPFVADGLGSIGEIRIEPTAGGTGRDEAHVVLADGRPVLVLPRRPARFAAGSEIDGDAVTTVASGTAGRDPIVARCDRGLATLALLLPLTHSATIRAVVPVGACEPDVAYPAILPDVDAVEAGWKAHRRDVRIEFPGTGIGPAFDAARTQLLLASDGHAVRRDGHRERAIEPGATETILGALDLLDRPTEVGPIIARWMDDLAEATPQMDAMFLTAISRHWLLHRVREIVDWMLPEVAGAVERLDRAVRRGRLEPTERIRAAEALELTAALLRTTGQAGAARDVDGLVARMRPPEPPPPASAAEALLTVATDVGSDGPAAHGELRRLLGEASPTSTFTGPSATGRTLGHDLAASAAFVHAGIALLVVTRADGLDLVPHLPDDWYGGPIEVHDLPTRHGVLSYGVRWHGTRPALLWDLRPHDGDDAPVLRAPGLDRTWETRELRGDALLGRVRPPRGLVKLNIISETVEPEP